MQTGGSKWNVKSFNLKNVKERIYSLGTWFYKDPALTIQVNYDVKFQEFEKILQYWQYKDLTIFGKNTVVKTLALSKLNYVMYGNR